VVPLDARAFAFWSLRDHRWEVEAGDFVIEVGASSHDIRGRVTVTSDGDGASHHLDATSTIGEWLTDPVGAQVLGAALAAAGEGAGALAAASDPGADAGWAEMVRQMPIGKVVSFTDMVTRDQVDQLGAAYEAASEAR
jgi:beta-glucosidase